MLAVPDALLASATDPDSDPVTYSLTGAGGSALPTWLSFDSSSRVISGGNPVPSLTTILEYIATDGTNPKMVTFNLISTATTSVPTMVNTIVDG